MGSGSPNLMHVLLAEAYVGIWFSWNQSTLETLGGNSCVAIRNFNVCMPIVSRYASGHLTSLAPLEGLPPFLLHFQGQVVKMRRVLDTAHLLTLALSTIDIQTTHLYPCLNSFCCFHAGIFSESVFYNQPQITSLKLICWFRCSNG